MAGQVEIQYYDASIPLLPVSGNTPFGFYDNDLEFQTDGQKFVKFAARRLGYPIMEIELQDINFYAALEDAVSVYGKELYEYKIRENYLSMEGNPTGSDLNTSLIQPNFSNIMRIAADYGSEVGSGGNIPYYTGSIDMTTGRQYYDLNEWASQNAELDPGDSIEVKRVFYEAPPAIVRYFDPYAGTGTGLQSLMETFGFGQFSPGINFMLMPVYFDVLKIQAIEFNDQIRKSAYTFEMQNNQLRIFPIPTFDRKLWFTYVKKSQKSSLVRSFNYNNTGGGGSTDYDPGGNNLITNVSNVPFTNITYRQINDIFKKWIFDYALAITKETLGNIRGVYNSIPVPGAEVTLNGQSLIEQANTEKAALVDQLRGTLDDTSRQKQMEKKSQEALTMRETFINFPMPIIIA
jgi:hypothetical protein